MMAAETPQHSYADVRSNIEAINHDEIDSSRNCASCAVVVQLRYVKQLCMEIHALFGLTNDPVV